tara:strand:+ start:3742 stop:4899 length:1158 start_codon:yes stop_codon:yes gene_type:complete
MTKSIKGQKSKSCSSNNTNFNVSKKIVVGLSGGVDSSLAAAILIEKGWDVEGLTLWLMKGKGACCSEGLVDAAGLCEDLGINHHIIDSRNLFSKKVIAKTTEGYKSGITPLPCSMCNKNVKFEEMLTWAKNQKEHTSIATGHYARVKKRNNIQLAKIENVNYSDVILMRGKDTNKDQSYFLYSLSRDVLRRLILPLGDLKKEETRKKANQLGLRTAQKPESQDLCLVEQYGSMSKFINSHISPKEGQIKHINGETVGKHQGIQHFTIGQRKGLGIAWHEPLYVKNLDSQNNVVFVASINELMGNEAIIKEVNWVSIEEPSNEIEVEAQIRYRSKPVRAKLVPIKSANNESNCFKLTFHESQSSITPGQAAVFYNGEILLGGGLIC